MLRMLRSYLARSHRAGRSTFTSKNGVTFPVGKSLQARGKLPVTRGIDWQVKLPEPVRAGDRLHEDITIIEKRPSSKPGRGVIKPASK
jgi:acyl dehydratase